MTVLSCDDSLTLTQQLEIANEALDTAGDAAGKAEAALLYREACSLAMELMKMHANELAQCHQHGLEAHCCACTSCDARSAKRGGQLCIDDWCKMLPSIAEGCVGGSQWAVVVGVADSAKMLVRVKADAPIL